MKESMRCNRKQDKGTVCQRGEWKRNGTRKLLFGFLCLAMTVLLFAPVTAKADMGPKPSVRILFENMGDTLCYGTLLSERESTGPAWAWDGTEENAIHNGNENYSGSDLDYEIWKAFVEYEDPDGYYFLQRSWTVSEQKEIAWTYYPPSPFKILLYYPETGTFVSSGIYEKYAFDTYYTVDMSGVQIGSVEYNEELSTDARLEAYRSYNYRVEVYSLLARIAITIIVEMVIALLFGFRKKRQLLLLAGVNTVTQVILNVLLNVINYNSGHYAFVFYYILFELIVFGLEAVVYGKYLNRMSEPARPKWFYVLYALVANGVSFAAGLYAAEYFPGIF